MVGTAIHSTGARRGRPGARDRDGPPPRPHDRRRGQVRHLECPDEQGVHAGPRAPAGVAYGRRRSSVVLALALALSAGLAGVLGLTGDAHPAAAAEPEALATITLTSVSPSLPSRDGTDHAAGTGHQHQQGPARPAAGAALARPVADHGRRRRSTPRSTRPRTRPSAAGSSTTRASSRTSTPPTSPTSRPGSRPPSRVSAEVSALALAPTDGVYLVGVHVTQNGVPVAVARSRVFVPVLSSKPDADAADGHARGARLPALLARPRAARRRPPRPRRRRRAVGCGC